MEETLMTQNASKDSRVESLLRLAMISGLTVIRRSRSNLSLLLNAKRMEETQTIQSVSKDSREESHLKLLMISGLIVILQNARKRQNLNLRPNNLTQTMKSLRIRLIQMHTSLIQFVHQLDGAVKNGLIP